MYHLLNLFYNYYNFMNHPTTKYITFAKNLI